MKTFHKASLFLFCLLGAVVLMQIAIAAHTILTSAGATSFTQLDEDVYAVYNISVNNTDGKLALTANITYMNITIPSTFNMVSASNTTSVNSGFSNTSTVLTWFNTTGSLVLNGTIFFSFNATAVTPGIYNISVTTLNQTGSYQTNLTITINDTTAPSNVAFADPSRVAGTNISTGILLLNISATDNGVFSNITINLYNATGARINQTNSSATQVNTTSLSFSFSGLADGNYTVNATAYDNYNNSNSSASRVFVIDATAPSSVVLTCTPSSVTTGDVVTCSCTTSDATSGVANTTFTVNPSTAQTGTFTTTCTATDYASNQASGTFQYTVGGRGNNAGGSGSSTETWTTFAKDNNELSAQGTVESKIGARQRVRLKIGGETHHVGVKSITATSAVIEVTSTPQEATFAVGETKKFDVNSDNYYDMSVTLSSIEASKANVVILAINEAVPASAASPGTATTDAASSTTSNGAATGRSMTWVWVLVALVVVIGIVFFIIRARKK